MTRQLRVALPAGHRGQGPTVVRLRSSQLWGGPPSLGSESVRVCGIQLIRVRARPVGAGHRVSSQSPRGFASLHGLGCHPSRPWCHPSRPLTVLSESHMVPSESPIVPSESPTVPSRAGQPPRRLGSAPRVARARHCAGPAHGPLMTPAAGPGSLNVRHPAPPPRRPRSSTGTAEVCSL